MVDCVLEAFCTLLLVEWKCALRAVAYEPVGEGAALTAAVLDILCIIFLLRPV